MYEIDQSLRFSKGKTLLASTKESSYPESDFFPSDFGKLKIIHHWFTVVDGKVLALEQKQAVFYIITDIATTSKLSVCTPISTIAALQ